MLVKARCKSDWWWKSVSSILLTYCQEAGCLSSAFGMTEVMINVDCEEIKESSVKAELCCEIGLMASAWSNRGNDANVPHANTAILGSRQPAFPSRWLPQSTAPHSELQSSASVWIVATGSLFVSTGTRTVAFCTSFFSSPALCFGGGTHGTECFRWWREEAGRKRMKVDHYFLLFHLDGFFSLLCSIKTVWMAWQSLRGTRVKHN